MFSAALLVSFAAVSNAGNPKTNETKSETSTPSKTEASVEQKDFYVDDSGNRIDIEYPTQGECEGASPQNCHALYQRANSSSPWVLVGSIVTGIRPF